VGGVKLNALVRGIKTGGGLEQGRRVRTAGGADEISHGLGTVIQRHSPNIQNGTVQKKAKMDGRGKRSGVVKWPLIIGRASRRSTKRYCWVGISDFGWVRSMVPPRVLPIRPRIAGSHPKKINIGGKEDRAYIRHLEEGGLSSDRGYPHS